MKAQACFFTVLIFLFACGSNDSRKPNVEAAAKSEPIAVQVAVAETREIDRVIHVTGSLHPDESVNVTSEVAGRVAQIHYDFGHYVRKGAVVAELDRTELTLQHDRARASLAQALARIGLDMQKLGNLRPAARLRHHAHHGLVVLGMDVVPSSWAWTSSPRSSSPSSPSPPRCAAPRPKRSRRRSPSASKRPSTPSAASTICGRSRPKASHGVGQFVLEKDPDVAAQEVRDKVRRAAPASARRRPAGDGEDFATDASPVINIVASSPRDLRETTKLVDDRSRRTSSRSPASARCASWATAPADQVWLDGDKLRLQPEHRPGAHALAAQNVEVPGGRSTRAPRETRRPHAGPRRAARRNSSASWWPTSRRPGAHRRHRGGGRRSRGAALAGAAGRHARRGAGGPQAGRHQHPGSDRGAEARVEELRPTAARRPKLVYARDQSKFIEERSTRCRST
jgi:pyruvate/2-oxoglutarate dehydrogenase complex dihydrolipoamide acyltransferase (E2) component